MLVHARLQFSLRLRWFTIFVTALLLAAGAVSGDTTAIPRYVANSGVDAGDCSTESSPCQTINYAIGQAASGDELRIDCGVYAENIIVDRTVDLTAYDVSGTICPVFFRALIAPTNGRAVHIRDNATVHLTRLEIADGSIFSGAGLLVAAGTIVRLHDVIIRNNTATVGAGISNNGDLTLIDSHVNANQASLGAGIHNAGKLTLDQSTVRANRAGQNGGGIRNFLDGTVEITASLIISNSAVQDGAGILNEASRPMTLFNTEVLSNVADHHGSGIYNSTDATLAIDHSTVNHNRNGLRSGFGGGLYNEGIASIRHSELSDNYDANSGAAIFNDLDGVVTVSDSAIQRNSGGNDGAIWNWGRLIIMRVALSHNVGGTSGGGIRNQSGAFLMIDDSQILSNTSSSSTAGGIYHEGVSLTIANSLIQGNQGSAGGGISALGPTTILSSTIRGNKAFSQEGGGIVASGALTLTHTAIRDNEAATDGGGLYSAGVTTILSRRLLTIAPMRATAAASTWK